MRKCNACSIFYLFEWAIRKPQCRNTDLLAHFIRNKMMGNSSRNQPFPHFTRHSSAPSNIAKCTLVRKSRTTYSPKSVTNSITVGVSHFSVQSLKASLLLLTWKQLSSSPLLRAWKLAPGAPPVRCYHKSVMWKWTCVIVRQTATASSRSSILSLELVACLLSFRCQVCVQVAMASRDEKIAIVGR